MKLFRTSKSISTSTIASEDDRSTTQPDGFKRYYTHSIIITCWALVVVAYLVVLHIAYKQSDHFGGKPASDKQILVYDILVFVRTLLSTVHIPIMTGVLMSIVPWIMMEVSPRSPSLYSKFMNTALPRKTKLPELFYLSDATWGSAPGWFTALSTGIKVKAISWPWIHLSAVVLFSYLGFPLLSLAYRIDGQNNFVDKDISVPNRLAYVASGTVDYVAKGYLEYGTCNYCDHYFTLASDQDGVVLYHPPRNDKISAMYDTGNFDNRGDFITMKLGSNIQVETVGLQVSSSATVYGVQNRTFHNLYQYNTVLNGTDSVTFDNFFNTSKLGTSESSKSILSDLQCFDSCSADEICQEQRSNRTLADSYLIQNGTDAVYLPLLNFSSTYEGASLSCVKISPVEGSSMKAMASIILAIEGRGNYTKIAAANVTISYALRTVNEASRTYIEPENAEIYPPENKDEDALSPSQLLNATSAIFTAAFHKDVYNLPRYRMLTDGLVWLSLSASFNRTWPTNEGVTVDSWDIPLLGTNYPLRRQAYVFSQAMLVSPLRELIGKDGFFRNETKSAIVPGTVMYMRHGRVPVKLAIIILVLPIIWTFILAILSTRDRRWTERLDGFSMFKLGSDYGGLLKEYKLSDLEATSKVLRNLSGIVLVTPSEGKVELKPSKEARGSAWDMELRQLKPVMTSKEKLHQKQNTGKGMEMSEVDLTETPHGSTSRAQLLESDIPHNRQQAKTSNGYESLLDSRRTSTDFDRVN